MLRLARPQNRAPPLWVFPFLSPSPAHQQADRCRGCKWRQYHFPSPTRGAWLALIHSFNPHEGPGKVLVLHGRTLRHRAAGHCPRPTAGKDPDPGPSHQARVPLAAPHTRAQTSNTLVIESACPPEASPAVPEDTREHTPVSRAGSCVLPQARFPQEEGRMAGQGLGVTWPSRGGGHHVGHLCSGSPPTPGTSPQPTSALATSLGHGQLRVLPWSPARQPPTCRSRTYSGPKVPLGGLT